MQRLRERLHKVGNWLNLHRRETIGVICVLAICVVTIPVLAAPPAGEGTGNVGWTEQLALWIAQMFAWISQGVVKMIALLIDLVIVPIMKYNHFVDSPVVAQGWVVVRDLVNMFFVVVLLVIAFQTIFNVGRADWKRQVPRLLIMAIVINFSRTICGILIDFGQVVMLTFVNAISDVAGGNFIQLFGLDKLYSLSSSWSSFGVDSGLGITVFDLFVTAFLTMVITFVILGTMIILAALLAFRIVILWCLVIVSPLTFFLGGAKGVVGAAEGYYSDWWKRFTSAVSLGPILTFFVWLALAAASSGNLAEKQGFETQVDSNGEPASIGGFLTSAFDAPHMTSLIIAIALLFAGFEVSQQSASSIGGRAGAMAASGIKGIPGLSRSLARIGVPVGAVAYAPGVALGAAYARQVGGPKGLYLGAKEKFGEGLRDIGRAVGTTGIAKVGGRFNPLRQVSQATMGAGIGLVQGVEHTKAADLQEAKKGLEGAGKEDFKAIISSTEGVALLPYKEKVKRQAAIFEALTNKNRRKQFTYQELQNLSTEYHRDIKPIADDPMLDKFGKALDAMPGLAAGDAEKDEAMQPGETQAAYRARIKKDRMKEINAQSASLASRPGSIASLDPRAFSEDADVRESFRNVKLRNGQTIAEYIAEGKAGPLQKERWEAAIGGDQDAKRTQLGGLQATVAGAAAGSPELTAAMTSLTNAIKNLGAEDVRAGVVTPTQLRDPQFLGAFTENAPDSAMAAMRDNPALMAAFTDSTAAQEAPIITNAAAATVADEQRLGRINAQRARAGLPPSGYDSEAGVFRGATPEEKGVREGAVEAMVQEQPEVVINMADVLRKNDFSNEVANAVARGVSNANINGLSNSMLTAPPDGQQRIANTMALLEKSIAKLASTTAAGSAERAALDAKLAGIMRFRGRFGK